MGANPNQSVVDQILMGAAGGTAAPLVTGAVGKGFQAATGVGRTVAPEVAALADTAQTKYDIPVASGQIGNTDAKVAFSQMAKTDPKAQAMIRQQRQAWMKGVTGLYGDPTGDVSPAALFASQDRIGPANWRRGR